MARAQFPRDILGPHGVIAQKLPDYETRESQLEMADQVAYAVEHNENAAIEAGTGTGKSLAYLVPAILSGKQTIVSTGNKALQQQLIDIDLPFLHSVMPKPFTSTLLKGKSNYACLHAISIAEQVTVLPPEFQTWSRKTRDGDLDKYNGEMTPDLRASVTIDSESCLGDRCPLYNSCWAELAKTKARQSDIIVANHALLMSDLALRSMTDGHAYILPTAEVYVADECHLLEGVATESFGVDVTLGRWNHISRAVARAARSQLSSGTTARWNNELAASTKELENVFTVIKDRLSANKNNSEALGDESPLARPAVHAIRSMARRMKDWTPASMSTTDRAVWKKATERVASYAQDLETTTTPTDDDAWIRYGGIEGAGNRARITLSAKPVNVAPILRKLFFNQDWTVIATSATLAVGKDMSYWRGRVGMDTGSELILDSPFDYYTNSLLYIPEDGSLFDSSAFRGKSEVGAYLDRLAEEIHQLLMASRGRAFVLFTSNNVMNETYQRLAPRLLDYLVLKQGDMPRPEMIRRFKEDGNAVLFGVKSFWEGVDVSGSALSLVIIDKFSFPPPDDPVWAAKCNSINLQMNDKWAWFRMLAIPTVIISMKQGVGRLIRSKSDRGVVAILDGRASIKPYGGQIIKALPPMQKTNSMEVVRTFFGKKGR